jgi:hypothetical protein
VRLCARDNTDERRSSVLQLDPKDGAIRVVPWPDAVIDALGVDPRSAYVETYWLGVLGPSTTWLLRKLAARLEADPGGFDLDLEEMAARLGLGHRGGRNSPFMRSLGRCIDFELAEPRGPAALAVRRRLPPLNRRQISRLPETLQQSHRRWQESQVRGATGVELQRRVLEMASRREPGARGALQHLAKSDSSSTRVRTPNPVPPLRR